MCSAHALHVCCTVHEGGRTWKHTVPYRTKSVFRYLHVCMVAHTGSYSGCWLLERMHTPPCEIRTSRGTSIWPSMQDARGAYIRDRVQRERGGYT